jgi:hypothetical protein
MVEPHKISAPGPLRRLWWWIRGVGYFDFRRICARCGRTGQAHFGLAGCIRFKRER